MSRDVIFDEAIMLRGFPTNDSCDTTQQKSGMHMELQISELASTSSSKSCSDEQDNIDTSNQLQLLAQPTTQYTIARNIDRRTTKKPQRFTEADLVAYAVSVAEDIDLIGEPSNYAEAINSEDSDKWMIVMHREMEPLHKNGTWTLEILHKNKKTIYCKWVFKRKEGILGFEEGRHKARLISKGYSQISGVDFTDVFSPVVKHSFIRSLLCIVVMHDFELDQLDVKTAFLHGELEEDIYMQQSERFVVPGKED